MTGEEAQEKRRFMIHNSTTVKLSFLERFLVLFGGYTITYLTIETDTKDIRVVDTEANTILARPEWLEKWLTRKKRKRKVEVSVYNG